MWAAIASYVPDNTVICIRFSTKHAQTFLKYSQLSFSTSSQSTNSKLHELKIIEIYSICTKSSKIRDLTFPPTVL